MKTLLVWIFALALTGVIISPFFWLWFLKRKSRWLYVLICLLTTITLFSFFFFQGYDILLDFFAKINANSYYYLYDAGANVFIIVPFLMLISPFVFTKIIYNKFSVKSFFLSLLFSMTIFVIFSLIFIYYIVPKAFEVLLKNI